MAEEERVTEEIKDDPNTAVDETHSSLTGIRADQAASNTEISNLYDGQINGVDTFTQQQIDAVKQNEKTQIANQNAMTDFTVNTIEQNKEETRQDYVKEQSASYVDWKQQSNQFGVNAERMASNGLSGTGYSESSQVAMYNTYQNRIATAREVFNKAILNYDNQITQARLQNSITIAEIAGKSLEKQLEIAFEGFQYKNELITAKADKITENNRYYDSLWKNMYDTLYTEAQDKQEQANWQAEMDYKAEQDEIAQANWQAEMQAKYGNKEEEEEIIINPKPTYNGGLTQVDGSQYGGAPFADTTQGTTTVTPPFANPNVNPTFNPKTPILDPMLNPLSSNKITTTIDTLSQPPKNGVKMNYPLENGKPTYLNPDQVHPDQINTYDPSPIKSYFSKLTDAQFDKVLTGLVTQGIVKEELKPDKDGKIMLTYRISNHEAFKMYVKVSGGTIK